MEWLLFYLIFLIFVYLDIKINKRWTISVVILILLSLGFRYKVGWDYDAYVKNYYTNILDRRIEIGYTMLVKNLKLLNLDAQIIFFITNSFQILVIGLISNRIVKKYRALSLLCYCNLYFGMNRYMSNLRQSISLSIFLVLIYLFLINKLKFKSYFFSHIGYFFHKSYIYSNLFIFLSRIKFLVYYKNRILILSVLFFFLSEGLIKILIDFGFSFKYLEDYFVNKTFSSLKTEKVPMMINFSIFLFFIISKKNFSRCKNNKILRIYNMCFISLIFLISLINLPKPILRMTDYGLILIIFIVPYYLKILKKNKCLNKIFHLMYIYIMLILFSIGFTHEFILGPESDNSLKNRTLKYNFKIFKNQN